MGWIRQRRGDVGVCRYDTRDGSLLLGRDRFGEKPLYLYQDETGLYFGSEVKFIVACWDNVCK